MADSVVIERKFNGKIYGIHMPPTATMALERFLLLARFEPDVKQENNLLYFQLENGTWVYEMGELEYNRFIPLTLIEGSPQYGVNH